MKSDKSCFFRLQKKACIVFLLFVFLPGFIFGNEVILQDHSKIQVLSDFMLMGTVELRKEKSPAAPVAFRTLNHENGMNVRVLEILGEGVYKEEHGRWLYILLTRPLWAETGEWLGQYGKFLIFLPDARPVYDFEK